MSNAATRFDNFSNLLSGLGVGSLDRTSNTVWSGQSGWRNGLSRYWASRYSLYDIADVYLSKGIAAKIIDRPADDCFQRGVEIEGDDDKLMANEYDRLSVMSTMANCVRWSRLYGGSAILLVVRDGGDFDMPLNFNNIDTIEELRVLDITCIKRTDRYYTNPTLPNYGQLEYYTVTPPGAQSFDVHESRLITMGGEPIPTTYNQTTVIPWSGRPVLESCINDISRYEQALEWSLRLLERKQQGIYNMSGLAEMVANSDHQLAIGRINMVDQVRSVLNSVIVDKDDTYNILNLGLDGLPPLLQEYQIAVSASSNIPIPILFGKSTTGLNATGSGDLESYYGMVQHIQSAIAYPTLEKLTSIIWLQTELKSKIPDDWHLVFNPLWSPTELEQANTANLNAQANSSEATMLIALMTNGIIDPEEVRKIIVNKYAEYGFPDALPSSGEDINYAEMVDLQEQVDGQTPEQRKTSSVN